MDSVHSRRLVKIHVNYSTLAFNRSKLKRPITAIHRTVNDISVMRFNLRLIARFRVQNRTVFFRIADRKMTLRGCPVRACRHYKRGVVRVCQIQCILLDKPYLAGIVIFFDIVRVRRQLLRCRISLHDWGFFDVLVIVCHVTTLSEKF